MMRKCAPRVQAVVIPSESSEFADELGRLLTEVGRSAGSFLTAECSPPLDIYETDDGFEIAMDLPGVEISAIRVVAKGNAVLIAGEKTPRRGRGDSSFHLVERSYGRFARVARLTKPCDSSQARATLVNGELRVSLPKIADRRGRTTTHPDRGRPPALVIRLLFIGDIVGRPGRELIRRGLAAIRDYHQIDLVIANVENAAAGFGITREIGDELLDRGLDVMTSGNHIWDRKEAIDYIGAEPRLLRPANFPAGVPGNGSYVTRTAGGVSVGVVNVMGRVFMVAIDDPFAVVLKEIEALKQRARVIFVDFHAEATSEKIAMGWHLDGKVTAMVGTHTHVQTADDRILPRGPLT